MVFWKVGFCHTESRLWLGNSRLLGHIPNRLKAMRMFLLKPWIPKDCYPWAPLHLSQLEVQSCNTSLSNALRHHSCHFRADFPQVLLLLATQAVSEILSFISFFPGLKQSCNRLKPCSPSKVMSKTKTAFEIRETVSIKNSPSILNSLFSQIPSVLCWTWGNLCLSRFWRPPAIPYLVFYNNLQLKCKSISGLKFAFRGHLDPVQIFTALTALKFMLVKAPSWGACVLTDPKVLVVLGLSFWVPAWKLY